MLIISTGRIVEDQDDTEGARVSQDVPLSPRNPFIKKSKELRSEFFANFEATQQVLEVH